MVCGESWWLLRGRAGLKGGEGVWWAMAAHRIVIMRQEYRWQAGRVCRLYGRGCFHK